MLSFHGPEIWPRLLGDIAKNGPGDHLALIILENLRTFIRGGLVTTLPWWPLALFYIFAARSAAWREELNPDRPALTFAWGWLGLALVTILPNKSNYYRYLMVMLPGLGLIAARLLSLAPNPAGWLWKRALPIFVGVQAIIYLVWAGYLGAAWFNFHGRLSDPHHFLLPAVLALCGLVGFLAVQWRNRKIVWVAAALACLSIVANGTYARDLNPKARRAALVRLAGEVLAKYNPRTTTVYDLGLTEGEWPLVLEHSGHYLKGRFQRTAGRAVWPDPDPRGLTEPGARYPLCGPRPQAGEIPGGLSRLL